MTESHGDISKWGQGCKGFLRKDSHRFMAAKALRHWLLELCPVSPGRWIILLYFHAVELHDTFTVAFSAIKVKSHRKFRHQTPPSIQVKTEGYICSAELNLLTLGKCQCG